MYCDGDIVEVNEDYRIKVELDQSSENPLDWGQGCEILTIDEYRMWRGWDKPEEPLAYVARVFHIEVRRGAWTTEQRDRAIRGYMNLTGDTREFRVYEWRGYSKGDWSTHLVLWDKETGFDQSEEWGAWRRGDVYTVVSEHRKVYTYADDPLDSIEEWEEGDSLGGCYLEDGYTAQDAAKQLDDYPEEG